MLQQRIFFLSLKKKAWAWDFRFYSMLPDLALSDYHVFRPLKDTFKERWFGIHDEVREAVHSWHKAQSKTFLFFSERITKLVQQCEKYIEQEGNVEKKWHFICIYLNYICILCILWIIYHKILSYLFAAPLSK